MTHDDLVHLVWRLNPDELEDLRRLIEVRLVELAGPPRWQSRERQAPERATVVQQVGQA